MKMSLSKADLKAVKTIVDESNRSNGVLLEDINHKFVGVLDGIAGIHQKLDDVPKRDEFCELKDEVKTIRLVVTGQSKQLSKHETRITKLEAGA